MSIAISMAVPSPEFSISIGGLPSLKSIWPKQNTPSDKATGLQFDTTGLAPIQSEISSTLFIVALNPRICGECSEISILAIIISNVGPR